MTILYWIISLAGVAMCTAGAYVLGKTRRIGALESTLAETCVKLRKTEEALNLQALEKDLSGTIQVSGETGVESARQVEPPAEMASETRMVEVDAKAIMDEADRREGLAEEKPVMSGVEVPGVEMPGVEVLGYEFSHLDMTSRVSIDSSDEMMLLSQQVDTLTDDLGRVHRKLKEEKAARRELESDSAQRCRRISELEGLIEKQRLELKRREDRIKKLLTEVGLTLDSDDAVVETLDALASIDITKKTPLVDLAELEEMNDNTVVDSSGGETGGLAGGGEHVPGPPIFKSNGS